MNIQEEHSPEDCGSQSGKAVWDLVVKCPESWEKELGFDPEGSGGSADS